MPTIASNSAAAVSAGKPILGGADIARQSRDLLAGGAAWLTTHWFQILIAAALAMAIVLSLHAARRLGSRLCARSDDATGWMTVFGRAIARTNTFFIVMLAAKLVGDTFAAAAPPQEVASTINFLWTVASVFQAAIWARELILGTVERRAGSDHYAGEALVSALGLIRLLVTFAVFAVAIVVVLDNLGVNVTGLVAGLGVGGIAIGLAAQGIFADLFAALAIIFDRPFRRGDAISYDKSSGTVESIGLKSTRIRAPTGEERIIANKQLLDKEILNDTKRGYRRVSFTLGLVRWTPVEVMERLPGLIGEVVQGCGQTFVRAGLTGLGASSYDFAVEFDTGAAFGDFYDARHRVGLAIIRRLDDEGIQLAYPTQTEFAPVPDGRLAHPAPAARTPAPATDTSKAG